MERRVPVVDCNQWVYCTFQRRGIWVD
jgi:hypothetical protein